MTTTDQNWLRGLGAVGELIARADWSHAQVGAPHAWPAGLRAVVALVAGAGFPTLLLWGQDLTVVAHNPPYRAILGGRTSAIGLSLFEAWPEARGRVETLVREALAGETVFLEAPLNIPGRAIWFRASFSPVRDDQGAPAGVMVTGVESSKEQAQARELRASETRFRAVANLVPDLLWSHDEHGQTVWYNQRWLDYTGQDAEQAHNGGWVAALHPDDRDASLEVGSRSMAERAAFTHEHRLRRRDGAYRWFLVRATPIRDPDTDAVRWFGAATDIHEQRSALDSLAASEESLRLALDVGRLAAWDWNLETSQVAWSDEHFRMLGYRMGEVPPSYEAWASRVDREDLPEVEAAIRAARQGRNDFAVRFRARLSDSRLRWISGRGRFFYQGDKAVRMVGVMEDITERRRYEQTQSLLLGELQHRTRNQLAVIRSIVSRTAEASADLEDFMSHFDGRLAAFARTQAALTRSAKVSLNLDALVRDEFLAAASAEQLEIDGPEVELTGKAAETMSLAVHELVTNAVKYGALAAPAGAVAVRWRIEEADEGPVLVFEWIERGVPILDVQPPRRGFGRRLIEEAMPYELGAETELVFAPGGVQARLHVPLVIEETEAPA